MTLNDLEDIAERVLGWVEVLISAILVVVLIGFLVYAFISAVQRHPEKVAEVKNVQFCQHPTVQAIQLAC